MAGKRESGQAGTARDPAAVSPARPAAGTPAPAARGQRRKRETRRRLLQAAYELMADRGRAAVAINEITEAADVGFGSFYNHFESKDDIHAAVVDDVLTRFGEALSHIAEVLDDPAEILSASIRYVALRARREPRWGRFLVRSGFSIRDLSRGMGSFLLQDLKRGIDAGRFHSDDLTMTLLSVGGTAAATITAELELAAHPDETGALAAQPDLEMTGLAERAAATALRLLGLAPAEAAEIASRALPRMNLEPGVPEPAGP